MNYAHPFTNTNHIATVISEQIDQLNASAIAALVQLRKQSQRIIIIEVLAIKVIL